MPFFLKQKCDGLVLRLGFMRDFVYQCVMVEILLCHLNISGSD